MKDRRNAIKPLKLLDFCFPFPSTVLRAIILRKQEKRLINRILYLAAILKPLGNILNPVDENDKLLKILKRFHSVLI
jgi:hypothetical protein